MISPVEIMPKDLMNNFKIEVVFRLTNGFQLRLWIASRLLWLACWFGNFKEVNLIEEKP